MKQIKVQVSGKFEQDWARGCPSCKYGIASAPELTGSSELYLERIAQALNGDIQFCTCKAGVRSRAHLLNRHQMLIEEARRDPRMAESAQRRSHPDIEVAQWKIQNSYAAMPTIHYESAAPIVEDGSVEVPVVEAVPA